MAYFIRIRDGSAFLDLLDLRGEVELFETRAAAMIRSNVMLLHGLAETVEVFREGEADAQVTLWRSSGGIIHAEASI